jgi:hypothetical protein
VIQPGVFISFFGWVGLGREGNSGVGSDFNNFLKLAELAEIESQILSVCTKVQLKNWHRI